MFKLNNPSCLPIKDMTSTETTLLYYLLKEDSFQCHLIRVSFSNFYLKVFGEIYKAGSSRKVQIEFNNAVNHFEELGLISTVLDSNNCKIVDISSLYKDNATPYVLIDDECYRIFRELDVAKHIKLKIFKTYAYLLTTTYKDPELKGKTYNNYNLGFMSATQICEDIELTYNTYSKYLTYLEDLELIYVNRNGGYVGNTDGKVIKPANIYCRYEDKDKADSFVSAKKSKSKTSNEKKEDISEDAYYEDMYAKVVDGDSNYTVDELRNCVGYIFSKDNNRDLVPLKTLITTKEAESVTTEVDEDYDMPF